MNNTFTLKPKSDDDVMMGKEGVDSGSKVYTMNADVDWNSVNNIFSKVGREDLAGAIGDVLFQTASRIHQTILKRYADCNSRENFVRSVFLELMSTPEYQLC